jgi:hypothetical protein
MAIKISEKVLSKRTQSIRKIFLTVSKEICIGTTKHNYKIEYYAKDSSSIPPGELFFKTNNPNVKVSYKEIWTMEPKNDWTLIKSYLKVVQKINHNEYPEIISLHLDLDEKEKNKYKCMPHLHVKHPKNESISNAHIGLNINDYETVTNSIEEFDKNLKLQIEMINDEFINHFYPE